MKLKAWLFPLSFALALASPALADEPKNLKVISKDLKGKDIEKAMKDLTKGLGVKCEACHVKGKFDADDVEGKVESRSFLGSVIGNKDEAARKVALAHLLTALDLPSAKDESLVWKGVDALRK